MYYFGMSSSFKLHVLQVFYLEKVEEKKKNLPRVENFVFSDHILHHPKEPTIIRLRAFY